MQTKNKEAYSLQLASLRTSFLLFIQTNVLFEGTTEEVENWYEKALENDTLDIRWFDDPTMFGFTNLGKSCFDKPYYKAKLEQL